MKLRTEVRDWDDLERDSSITWRGAVGSYRDYIEEREDVAPVFENVETGQQCEGSDPHRFAPKYADKQYAKLKDLERGLRDEYGKLMHTAMLTFTASSEPRERPLPPVDHLDGLLDSWDAIRRELERVLDGRQWERLAILEPHKSGYLHIHMAVFVQGIIDREMFAPVIEAHLRNCDIAGREAHDVTDDSTISVKRVGSDRESGELENLGTYLAEYLGTYGDDPLEAGEHVQMANTVLWATGRQRWRPSNGAQYYMAADTRKPDEYSPWSFVGIKDGDEVRPAPEGGGGVDTFVTGPVLQKGRPPP